MTIISAAQRFKQLVTPSRNPSAGENFLYPKTDNKWYSKDSGGAETLVGPATTPTKTTVGLGNVDNTADVDKPMSTPTKTYVDTGLSTKSDSSHIHAGLAPMLDIKDENSLLTNAPVGLNFLGDGVTATGTTEIQIAIPGVPIGCIMQWPTATPPTGWLICNGTAVPAGTQYDTLRALLTPAPWNGLLPDFTGRSPTAPGAAFGSGTVRNLGGKHGSDEIAVSQLPTHAHTSGTLVTNSTGGHLHTVSRRSGAGSAAGAATGTSTLDGDINTSTAPNHSHDVSGNTGNQTVAGGSPYLNPTLIINFIIRAA